MMPDRSATKTLLPVYIDTQDGRTEVSDILMYLGLADGCCSSGMATHSATPLFLSPAPIDVPKNMLALACSESLSLLEKP